MTQYKNLKGQRPLTITLADGSLIDFPAGDFRTNDAKIISLIDRHPNFGILFYKVSKSEVESSNEATLTESGATGFPELSEEAKPVETPEIKEIPEVTTVQQAAEYLESHFNIEGIKSKAGAKSAAVDVNISFPNL